MVTLGEFGREEDSLLRILPSGFVPERLTNPAYVPPDQATTVLCTCIITFVIASLFVLGRLFSRRSVLGNFFLSDTCVVVSLLLTGIFTVIQCLAAKHGGWGKHIYDISLDTRATALKYVFAHQLTYPPAVYFMKLSILLFFLRMGPKPWMRKFIFGMMVYTTALAVVMELVTIFQCRPLRGAWDLPLRLRTTPPGKFSNENIKKHGVSAANSGNCVNIVAMWYCISLLHVIGDGVMLTMPVEMVWRVRQTAGLGQTLKVAGLFALGIVACGAAVARVVFLLETVNSFDFTWMIAGTAISAQCECTIGIICICIPSLRPFATIAVTGTWSGNQHSSRRRGTRTRNGGYNEKSKSRGAIAAEAVVRWTRDFKLRSVDLMSTKDSRTRRGDGTRDESRDEIEKEYPADSLFCNFQLRQDPLKGDVEMGIRMELGDFDRDSTVSKPRNTKNGLRRDSEIGVDVPPGEKLVDQRRSGSWEEVVVSPKKSRHDSKRPDSPGGNTFGVPTPNDRSAASSQISIPGLAVLHNNLYSHVVTVFPTENSVRIQKGKSTTVSRPLTYYEDDDDESEETKTTHLKPLPRCDSSQSRPISMSPLRYSTTTSATYRPSFYQTPTPPFTPFANFPVSPDFHVRNYQEELAQSRKNSTTSQITAGTEISESKWVREEIEDYWEFLDHNLGYDVPTSDMSRDSVFSNGDCMGGGACWKGTGRELTSPEPMIVDDRARKSSSGFAYGDADHATKRWTTSFGDSDEESEEERGKNER